VADDDGPVSYETLAAGTRVVDRFGTEVGDVVRVLTLNASPYFDGIVVATAHGRRFVDAPEVGRMTTASVHLTNTRDDVLARRFAHTAVSDTDREEAIAALKQAYVDDRLTADELGDRIERCYDCTTLDELQAVVPDED
jgi:hypothetical protein